MDGRAREELIDRRLRELGSLCGALLGGAGLCAVLVLVLTVRAGGELAAVTPGTLPFVLALAAMLVILLSSAARAGILRRALEQEEEEEKEEEEEGAGRPEALERQGSGAPLERHHSGAPLERHHSGAPLERHHSGAPLERHRSGAPLERRLSAYVRATQVSFAMLAAAAAAGLAAALAGGVPFYGLVVCATSTLVMTVRWPRRVAVEHLLEGLPGETRHVL
jgi:hypothetical protein